MPLSCKAELAYCSSIPGCSATKWPTLRTTFASWASPSWPVFLPIRTGITCSGTPGSARRPRYGTAQCAATARDQLADPHAKARIAEWIPPDIVEQVPLELPGLVAGLPAETAQIPWDGPQVRIIEHRAHAPGHAALLIEERGVLVAGDMLSDVLIPMLDLNDTADPIKDYLAALRLLEAVTADVDD